MRCNIYVATNMDESALYLYLFIAVNYRLIKMDNYSQSALLRLHEGKET